MSFLWGKVRGSMSKEQAGGLKVLQGGLRSGRDPEGHGVDLGVPLKLERCSGDLG